MGNNALRCRPDLTQVPGSEFRVPSFGVRVPASEFRTTRNSALNVGCPGLEVQRWTLEVRRPTLNVNSAQAQSSSVKPGQVQSSLVERSHKMHEHHAAGGPSRALLGAPEHRGRIRPLPRIMNDELPLLPSREERAGERRALRLRKLRAVSTSTPSPRPSPPLGAGERESAGQSPDAPEHRQATERAQLQPVKPVLTQSSAVKPNHTNSTQ